MRAAPAISCATCTESARMSIRGSGGNPTFPAQWLLRLIACSPRRTALLPPSLPRGLTLKSSTPAPRRQDHTSLPYAFAPFVIGTTSVHRNPPHVRGDHDTP